MAGYLLFTIPYMAQEESKEIFCGSHKQLIRCNYRKILKQAEIVVHI